MVKKLNLNNIQSRNAHAEDEVSEEEEMSSIKKDEENQNAVPDNKNSKKILVGQSSYKGGLEIVKKAGTMDSSNQAGQTDESLEGDSDLPKANPRP